MEQGEMRGNEVAFGWKMLKTKLIKISLGFVLHSGRKDQRFHNLSIDALAVLML